MTEPLNLTAEELQTLEALFDVISAEIAGRGLLPVEPHEPPSRRGPGTGLARVARIFGRPEIRTLRRKMSR